MSVLKHDVIVYILIYCIWVTWMHAATALEFKHRLHGFYYKSWGKIDARCPGSTGASFGSTKWRAQGPMHRRFIQLVRWVIPTPVGKLLRSLKKQKRERCEKSGFSQKKLLKVVQDFVHHCYWQSQGRLRLLTDTDMLQCWSVAFIVQLGWSWLVIIALKNMLNTCAGAAASAAPTSLRCPVGGRSDQSPHTLNTCRAFFRQCAK